MRKYDNNYVKEPLYRVWIAMRARCNSPNCANYKNYGARGIKVCDEWNEDYISFRTWAFANGYKPGHKLTIDRINNDGNYEPDNCRIADYLTQAGNTRKNVRYTYNGETHTASEWARRLGIERNTMAKRVKKWGIEKALTQPRCNSRWDRKENYLYDIDELKRYFDAGLSITEISRRMNCNPGITSYRVQALKGIDLSKVSFKKIHDTITSYMEENNLNQTEMASRLGIAKVTLHDLLFGYEHRKHLDLRIYDLLSNFFDDDFMEDING